MHQKCVNGEKAEEVFGSSEHLQTFQHLICFVSLQPYVFLSVSSSA